MRLDADTPRLPRTIRLKAPRRLAIVAALGLFAYSTEQLNALVQPKIHVT